ncbi:MAG TPA: glycine cleavage system protein H [Mycobacterium sp.]|nr:glycine cleavage system protein H [Mycobacterium sp.]
MAILTDTDMSVDRSVWVPGDRRYTDLHSWLRPPADQVLGDQPLCIGVTEAVVEGLRIISVELPPIGTAIEAGEACALIWSSPLSAMPVYAPISALVTDVNAGLREDPGPVARDPFHTGWLFTALPTDRSSADGLLTASEYAGLQGVTVSRAALR